MLPGDLDGLGLAETIGNRYPKFRSCSQAATPRRSPASTGCRSCASPIRSPPLPTRCIQRSERAATSPRKARHIWASAHGAGSDSVGASGERAATAIRPSATKNGRQIRYGRSDMSLSRSIKPLLLSGALLFGAFASRAQSEELRIGFIAPMTGIFAQVGKDMVNGFQMYLDEHGGKLGGMDVKFMLEDGGQTGYRRHQSQEARAERQVQMFIGGVLASTGYALAPVSTEMKTVYIAPISAADDLTQRQARQISLFDPHRLVLLAAEHTRSANGPAIRATRKSSRSAPTMPSAMSRSAASRRRSRIAAARSSRRSGRRSAPRISGPSSPPSRPMPMPCSR